MSNTCDNSIILCDSICNHQSCFLSSLRGLRNGLYYGGKVRFTHALVMSILFKRGSLKHRAISIAKLTWEHARNLGVYVFFYKLLVCFLQRVRHKQSKFHSLIAGFVVGGLVFKDKTAVNSQIMLYLLSRVITGGAQRLADLGYLPNVKVFTLLSAACWGIVMFLFEDDAGVLQQSLKSSMNFLYRESDLYESWRDFIPFSIPF